jgi:UDP-N-acetylmuramoyl-L-alanyl-D-glutamate--2,6-diaminopimelate ligase
LTTHPSHPSVTVAGLAAAVPGARLHDDAGRAGSVVLHDATLDSRAAGRGVLFVCRPGTRADGHEFAPEAVAAGSPALLVERVLPLDVPQVVVGDVAAATGEAAATIHGDPAGGLLLLGVTGTNGKTTTAYLLERILRAAGHVTGLIGTVRTLVAGKAVPGFLTTPEATDLQRLLASMVAQGVTAAVMEVSSHGLALGRMNGTRVDVAAFTNLSQDHLDFHASLDDYFAAKATLFTPARAAHGVVNVDDEWGRKLLGVASVPLTTVSALGAEADVVARQVETRPDGTAFEASAGGRTVRVSTPLPGEFNAHNALLALAVALAAGLELSAAVDGVAALEGVPGRMERVEAGQPFTVLVDYAHTPDSLERVLTAARGLGSGRVIVVVGCGGDRDQHKRPLMGRAASTLADVAVLTSDNPRSEDPDAIVAAMEAGARSVAGAAVRVQVDRRRGIALALAEARPGDVVVIAGKGHEDYQEVAGRRLPFDDRSVATALLAGEEGER